MESSYIDQDSGMEVAAEELVGILSSSCSDSCLVDLNYYENIISKNKIKVTNCDMSTRSPANSDSSDVPKPETVAPSCEKNDLVASKTLGNVILPDISPTPTAMIVTETHQSPQLKSNKKKISLQSYQLYRRELGAQIHSMKPSEKIGIKPTSPTPSTKEGNIPAPKGKGTLCCYCGFSSGILNKCERCGRLINNGKIVDIRHGFHSPQNSKVSPPVSKESFYGAGNRRTKVRRQLDNPPARQSRPKFEEPQCVTLSSDEDVDETQVISPKKLKEDHLVESSAVIESHTINKEPYINSGEQESSGTESSMKTEDEEDDTPPDEKEVVADLARWKEVGLKGTFFAVRCRSTRIGSYRVVPTDRVLFSSEGIMIEIPEVGPEGSPSERLVKIVIISKQILKLDMHPGKSMPVIFLSVTPSAAKIIREKLHMVRESKMPYLDIQSESESERRITLLPIELTDDAKNAIKQAFHPGGIYSEISQHEANRILVNSSPCEVREMIERLPSATTAETTVITPSKSNISNKENGGKVDVRITRGSAKGTPRPSIPAEPMFSWSEFPVNTDDYNCLNQEQLLNDSIIDFYLRYVFRTQLDTELQSKCHVLSSFFYQRLTSRPAKIPGRKHPIEDDPKLSAAEKRHSRVKSWTKKVDIFEKDFIIIPINEHSHWFLAIVCFPGLKGPVTVKDNRPVKLSPRRVQPQSAKKLQRVPLNKLSSIDGRSFMIGSTTITPVVTSPKAIKNIPLKNNEELERDEKDEAESDEDVAMELTEDSIATTPESKEPIKQPCILIFDSLVGCSRNRVMATLRDYLQIEYKVKKGEESSDVDQPSLFTKETMPGSCLKVPQQNNYSDCGVYVLQYAESFMKKPFTDYRLPLPSMHNWFSLHMAGKKRKDIQHLLIRLTKENSTNADQVLKLLPSDDVKVALNGKQILAPIGGTPVSNDVRSSPPPDTADSTMIVDLKTSESESSVAETVPNSRSDEASSLSSSQQINGQVVNVAQLNSGEEMVEDDKTSSPMDTS